MRKAIFLQLIIIGFAASFISCGNKSIEPLPASDRMEWWRESRFGLFIHWGIYSIPAGEWKGNTKHDVLIRETAKIPLNEYNVFVDQFNPVKFDADEWVKRARDAGMKYIVITSKHHDGFCLFDSDETEYDIMATPFKRDILKEISKACSKYDIVLCFYYSIMDWHHVKYIPKRAWEKNESESMGDMEQYKLYMKRQLKELLTKYGSIGVLWFDGEWEKSWTHEDGEDLYKYLRGLKPELIINNRVDKGRTDNGGISKDSTFYGDFGTPEQEIPVKQLQNMDWESCMTMNNHWVYNKADTNWKSPDDLVKKLIDIVSKGGNFLLNVGPTAEGVFPQESIIRLNEIGDWIRINGSSIYGTKAGPFQNLEFGRSSQKIQNNKSTVFIHVFDWPEDGIISIPSLKANVKNAYALHEKHIKITVEHSNEGLLLKCGNISPFKYASVIALEMEVENIALVVDGK